MDAKSIDYDQTVECHGIQIPIVRRIVNERLLQSMRRERYERGEVTALRGIVKPTDRVLDIGAGVGLISAIAAQIVGPKNVVAIEANPEMMPMIEETHRINGVAGINALNGAAVTQPTGSPVPFHLQENFWSSTMDPASTDSAGFVRTCMVPEIDLNSLMQEFQPTVLSVDIEGGELSLFDTLDMSSLRTITLELHPRQYGPAGVAHILATLMSAKFVYHAGVSPGGSVVVLRRFSKNVAAVSALRGEKL